MSTNFKNGVVRKGSSTPGHGTALGNVKNGVVRKGSSTPGHGSTVGKVRDYPIKGAEYLDEAEKVACYHFLVRNIF